VEDIHLCDFLVFFSLKKEKALSFSNPLGSKNLTRDRLKRWRATI
jgi:hypothetical protein